MKTAKKTFLPTLLICIFGFAIGCEQEVQDQGQTASPAVSPTAAADDTSAKSDDSDEQLTIAGKPSAVDPSSPQASGSSDTSEDLSADAGSADAGSTDAGSDTVASSEDEDEKPAEPTIDIPSYWKRLSKTQEIWVDHKNKQVIVGGKICLDAGPLEMLICPRGTKEHETIVSVNAESWQVHAALIAVGATPGVPSRWVPEYTPAWGPKIDVQMMWRDEKTKQIETVDGKQWILNSRTQKPMTTELVFGGSYSEPRMEGDRPRYVADDGELICLANFSTSTIDLRILDKDADIFFEANTPLIPPINTQIYTIIKPGAVVGKPEE